MWTRFCQLMLLVTEIGRRCSIESCSEAHATKRAGLAGSGNQAADLGDTRFYEDRCMGLESFRSGRLLSAMSSCNSYQCTESVGMKTA